MQERARAAPLDAGTERHEDVEQHVDVTDTRDVGQLARLIGQHARGDEWERRVLVAFDGDASRERASADHLQASHQKSPR